ncbi:MAG: hypothetical protein ABI551_08315 [Polyangiaceae bacterium]
MSAARATPIFFTVGQFNATSIIAATENPPLKSPPGEPVRSAKRDAIAVGHPLY